MRVGMKPLYGETSKRLDYSYKERYVNNLDCYVVKKNVDEIKMKYLLSLR